VGELLVGEGASTRENRIEAHKWLSLAAAQGVEAAAKARDALARKMTAQELAEASRRAKAFTVTEYEVSSAFLRKMKVFERVGKAHVKGILSDDEYHQDIEHLNRLERDYGNGILSADEFHRRIEDLESKVEALEKRGKSSVSGAESIAKNASTSPAVGHDSSGIEAAKARADYLVRSGIVVVTKDSVNGNVHVSRARSSNARVATNYVYLDAFVIKGKKPSLVIGAVHFADDWIFATSVDFKIGQSVITLKDDRPSTDVLSGGAVRETLALNGDRKNSQEVIKAVASGRCKLCALRGSKGDRSIAISKDEFLDVLMVYFALGGEPLNATD